ncbi:MAG: hypothetical protein GPJ52_02575 [Candidatus Heimdallarchaeota archaeon]|nr:hypothetical protein [Candidatus Heimdallarchaeota archaeon]
MSNNNDEEKENPNTSTGGSYTSAQQSNKILTTPPPTSAKPGAKPQAKKLTDSDKVKNFQKDVKKIDKENISLDYEKFIEFVAPNIKKPVFAIPPIPKPFIEKVILAVKSVFNVSVSPSKQPNVISQAKYEKVIKPEGATLGTNVEKELDTELKNMFTPSNVEYKPNRYPDFKIIFNKQIFYLELKVHGEPIKDDKPSSSPTIFNVSGKTGLKLSPNAFHLILIIEIIHQEPDPIFNINIQIKDLTKSKSTPKTKKHQKGLPVKAHGTLVFSATMAQLKDCQLVHSRHFNTKLQ